MFALRISANACRSRYRSWLLAVFCVISPASAQYSFDVWTAHNGLPQNIISGIGQTADGYLWLATCDGLVRFDGVRFTVFDKSNSPGIDSNLFESLYQAAQEAGACGYALKPNLLDLPRLVRSLTGENFQ